MYNLNISIMPGNYGNIDHRDAELRKKINRQTDTRIAGSKTGPTRREIENTSEIAKQNEIIIEFINGLDLEISFDNLYTLLIKNDQLVNLSKNSLAAKLEQMRRNQEIKFKKHSPKVFTYGETKNQDNLED